MAVKKLETEGVQVDSKLDLGSSSIELPVIVGSQDEKALDISKLRAQTGVVTLDPGYVNTASCESEITFLNGEQGILQYRGYSIEDLTNHCEFLDISYLLIFGELPSPSEKSNFHERITHYSKTPEGILQLMGTLPKSTHPMGVLSSVFSVFSGFFPEFLAEDPDPELELNMYAILIAQIKNIIAYWYRTSISEQSIGPEFPKFDYSSDFYHMMFGKAPSPSVTQVLNKLLILHADHEQNCSTSTVRLVGSSKANLAASIGAGVSALWGPLHGGANQAVIEMLDAINKAGGDYKKFLDKAKDKNDPFKLMGFGHRVYKNFDPRALLIKDACDSVFKELGVTDPLLTIAKGLEHEALNDPYFKDRKLYPNVDFYSGIIYKALGIPVNLFTPMFALGRLPGWLAQWREMRHSSAFRIGRPRQIYIGETKRKLT